MPTTSIDTFFACTIIIAAGLISTAFLCSTLHTGISSTQDVNKESYLKAIADRIVTSTGAPVNWGASSCLPTDFGLAVSGSAFPYEVDMDKITRLNSLNNYSVSYPNMAISAQLNDIALGITVSQIMAINIAQSSHIIVGSETSFTFTILTSIDSEPTSASLHAYAVAYNYVSDVTNSTSGIGVGYVTIQIPSADADNAMLIVFAGASFDDRITSYAIYNFSSSTQESAPSNDVLTLSPLNYVLSVATKSSGVTVENGYALSYAYKQNLTVLHGTEYSIPEIVDRSPLVIVVSGLNNGTYCQEWVSYPQVPLTAGSSFEGSERNIFSYVVTINGVLYKLEVSLGDPSL